MDVAEAAVSVPTGTMCAALEEVFSRYRTR